MKRCILWFGILCAWAPSLASANGRAPISNGVYFKPGDNAAIFVRTTFGLLVSPDGCHFYWLCENNIGYGGTFDPAYAITGTGAIVATTFQGLRISHDGGCSFVSATSQLGSNDPDNISNMYLVAAAVGPTGEIWVGSSDAVADNSVFTSVDDGVTFSRHSTLPTTWWYQTIKVAPSDPKRVYIAAYQVPTSDPDAGQMPAAAHLLRSDDDGMTFTEMPLTGIIYGAAPQIRIQAVDPTNENIVYIVSPGSVPQSGDRVYRSSDGGATFNEVLETKYGSNDIVIRDANTVVVATEYDTSYQSIDGGLTFQPLVNAPQLACLGQRGDGVLFGCGNDYTTDTFSLASSTDAQHWTPVLKFEYISGPLSCPAGTVEHDTCDQQMWSSFAAQFGITGSMCSNGPDGVADAPPARKPPTTNHRQGCCDAGATPSTAFVAGLVALLLRRRRSTFVDTYHLPRARS